MLKNKRDNYKTKDIADIISKEMGLSKKFSEDFVKNVFTVMIECLKEFNILKLANFGSFKILSKASRVGRNTKNKKEYEISSRKTVVFKSSKYLLKKLNG